MFNLQSPLQRSHNNKAILLNVVFTRDYGIQSIVVSLFYLFCMDITGIDVFMTVLHAFISFACNCNTKYFQSIFSWKIQVIGITSSQKHIRFE